MRDYGKHGLNLLWSGMHGAEFGILKDEIE